MAPAPDFYLRYYVGHKGKFGHEFLEFEFRPDGQVKSHDGLPYCHLQPQLLVHFLCLHVSRRCQKMQDHCLTSCCDLLCS